MTLRKSVFLIVYVLSSALVTSVPVDNHPKEDANHKSLQVTGNPLPDSQSSVTTQQSRAQDYTSRVPKSTFISQESTGSVQESPSGSQNVPASVQQKPQEFINSQRPPTRVGESSSTSPKDTVSSNGLDLSQGSVPSSIERNASSQESKGISENALQRVKLQQRRRRPWFTRLPFPGNTPSPKPKPAKGTLQPFCNQFGCKQATLPIDANVDKQPVRPNRNSQCPSGTRLDRKYNRCRRVLTKI